MSALQQQLSNFTEFPGSIDFDLNLYVFPKLIKTGISGGKDRQWQIFVRIVKEGLMNKNETQKPNWNLMVEQEAPLKNEYLKDGFVLDGMTAQYFSETGYISMKITRSSAVYCTEKNIGRKNYRNSLQTALIQARAKYLTKINEGYSIFREQKIPTKGKKETEAKETKDVEKPIYFPMLAHNWKDHKKNVKFPVLIQPKLDGLRAVSYYDPVSQTVKLYSRQKKEYPTENLNSVITQLTEVLKSNPTLYIDGEIYTSGQSLQQINSNARTGKTKQTQSIYHIFDLFWSDKNPSFKERYDTIQQLKSQFNFGKNVQIVNSVEAKNQSDIEKCYKHFLDQGYEGIVIRNPTSVYSKSETKTAATRSKNLLKYKPIFDDEFEIVDYKQGQKGKDKGAIIFVMKTKEGKIFNSVPNMTYSERYKLFEQAQENFDKLYKNTMGQVEYRGLSDDGIPLQPKFIRFRPFK